jgi:hypothetical protein
LYTTRNGRSKRSSRYRDPTVIVAHSLGRLSSTTCCDLIVVSFPSLLLSDVSKVFAQLEISSGPLRVPSPCPGDFRSPRDVRPLSSSGLGINAKRGAEQTSIGSTFGHLRRASGLARALQLPRPLDWPSLDLDPCTKKTPWICELNHTAVTAAMRHCFRTSNHATSRCWQKRAFLNR